MAAVRDLPNRIVHVIAERLTALVSVEQRWKYSERQRSRNEQRMPLERGQNEVANFLRARVCLGELLIVLRPGGLVSRRDTAVHPICVLEQALCVRHLLGRQHIWYL
jgi:hypothetical protein